MNTHDTTNTSIPLHLPQRIQHRLHRKQHEERAHTHQRLLHHSPAAQLVAHRDHLALLLVHHVVLRELEHRSSLSARVQVREPASHTPPPHAPMILRRTRHALRQHEMHVARILGQDHTHHQLLRVRLLQRRGERHAQRVAASLLLQHTPRRQVVATPHTPHTLTPPVELVLPPAQHREAHRQLHHHRVALAAHVRGGHVADDVSVVHARRALVDTALQLLCASGPFSVTTPRRDGVGVRTVVVQAGELALQRRARIARANHLLHGDVAPVRHFDLSFDTR